jgi:hypothetical protein
LDGNGEHWPSVVTPVDFEVTETIKADRGNDYYDNKNINDNFYLK